MAEEAGERAPTEIALSGVPHILALASDFGAEVISYTATSAIIRATPYVYGGGRPEWFYLKVSCRGGRVSVREQASARRLPGACPKRHVNHDGSFCLGWRQEDPSAVKDEADARVWWAALVSFLGQQLYADACRRWPRGQERAHGDAADHEADAERLAASFGPGFLVDLRLGHLRLRRLARSVRLERRGRRLFALRDGAETVANLRAACPCATSKRRLVLRSCGNHAVEAVGLLRAMAAWQIEEARYYRDFAKQSPCCGTMDGCPLSRKDKG